jgi:hypothetical protein
MRKIFFFLIALSALTLMKAQSNTNPDISLIGTFNTYSNFIKDTPEYGKLNFETPSMEMFVDGYLNPYSRATANIAYEEGEFAVEELYAQILRGLPLDLQVKAGKFLVGFGKINTIHPHAWAFLERPLFHQIYFGAEGFNDIGIDLSYALPFENFYSLIDFGIFKGDAIAKTVAANPDDASTFYDLRGNNPVFVGRWSNFFQLNDYSDLELGLSGSYGVHSYDYLTSESRKALYYTYTGLDFKYKYRADAYTSFVIQGEGLLNSREVNRTTEDVSLPNENITTFGAFIYFDYQFAKQFSVGLKYDFTYGIIGDEPGYATLSNDDKNKTQGISGWFGFYPVEETLAFRLGAENLFFNYAYGTSRDSETTIKLQMIFSLGPHKAHPF